MASNVVQAPMDVLLEGYLVKSPPIGRRKRSNFKRWRQRYFVLWAQTKELEYFVDASMQVRKGIIDLNACYHINEDIPHQKYEHVFSLAVPGRKYYLVAGSAVQRDEWVTKMREIVRQPVSRLRRKPRSVSNHNFSEPVCQPPSSPPANRADDDDDDSDGVVRSNTAPSIRSSRCSSAALNLVELSSSPHYLYPAMVQGDHVWLKLDYPNLLLFESLDQPPVIVWPIPYLRGYGQVGSAFQFDAGTKCQHTGVWNVDLLEETHNIASDIDNLIRAQTMEEKPVAPAPSNEPSLYVTLEFKGGATSTDHVRLEHPSLGDTVLQGDSSDDEDDQDDYGFRDTPSPVDADDYDEDDSIDAVQPARSTSKAMQMLSSTRHVEYADISELKTLALQRAMSGQGTPPTDTGLSGDRQLRRRRTRHDASAEEREQFQPLAAMTSVQEEEDIFPSGSGAVDDMLKDIDDLYEEVERARVKAYETVDLTANQS
eukprot:m.72395 g.72395  ORF g.72395 m.72395 type:complete len:484 (+) comp14256_c0_seq3:62-1513(+)